MLLEICIAILLGVIAGIITGLIPGVHINLVSLILVSLSPIFLQFTSPLPLVIFIVANAVTHTFLDFIPSIFLGVPDAETALSILPGHKLLLLGFAFEAVKFTTIGSLLSVISSIMIFPFLIFVVPGSYEFLRPWIGYILAIIVIFMIFKEPSKNKRFWALFIFTISGVFGYTVLNFPNLSDPMLPMLSGLFGLSMLITSVKQNSEVPCQRVTDQLPLPKKVLAKSIGAGTLAGTLTGFFPGLGGAQASIIGSCFVGGRKKIGTEGFLTLQGGINTVNFLISLVTLYTLQKARNGAVIAVLKIIKSISFSELLVILASCLIIAGIATFLSMRIVRVFIKIISKINYRILSIAIMVLIVAMSIYFSGWIGLLILIVATLIGLVPIGLGIGKNHAMGCILLPVILYFIL
jgi:putative membrane protein